LDVLPKKWHAWQLQALPVSTVKRVEVIGSGLA